MLRWPPLWSHRPLEYASDTTVRLSIVLVRRDVQVLRRIRTHVRQSAREICAAKQTQQAALSRDNVRKPSTRVLCPVNYTPDCWHLLQVTEQVSKTLVACYEPFMVSLSMSVRCKQRVQDRDSVLPSDQMFQQKCTSASTNCKNPSKLIFFSWKSCAKNIDEILPVSSSQ